MEKRGQKLHGLETLLTSQCTDQTTPTQSLSPHIFSTTSVCGGNGKRVGYKTKHTVEFPKCLSEERQGIGGKRRGKKTRQYDISRRFVYDT